MGRSVPCCIRMVRLSWMLRAKIYNTAAFVAASHLLLTKRREPMAKFTIEGAKRPDGSKPNALRRDKKIPATIYGHNGTESVQIVLDEKAMTFLDRDAVERKSLVNVTVPDLKLDVTAVIQEVQRHPWKGYMYHVSFFAQK
jgi:large subunit ribosomal protein L25